MLTTCNTYGWRSPCQPHLAECYSSGSHLRDKQGFLRLSERCNSIDAHKRAYAAIYQAPRLGKESKVIPCPLALLAIASVVVLHPAMTSSLGSDAVGLSRRHGDRCGHDVGTRALLCPPGPVPARASSLPPQVGIAHGEGCMRNYRFFGGSLLRGLDEP